MKNLFLTIILIVFYCINVTGQSFAPVGATWKILSCFTPTESPPCYCNEWQFSVSGMTEVQGKQVKVLSRGSAELYIYEEDNRIYVYEGDSFYLLMDFNLNVGDTMFHQYTQSIVGMDEIFTLVCMCEGIYDRPVFSVVREDTTLQIKGHALKQLRFSTYTTHEIYIYDTIYYSSYAFTERLGGSYWDDGGGGFSFVMGILGGPAYQCAMGFCCDDILMCYEDEEIQVDFSSKSENCVYTSIEEPEIEKSLSIYPNPTTQTLHIQSQSAQHTIRQVNIIDISGRTIIAKDHPDVAGIDVSALPQGLYFWEVLIDNGELLRGKFVKQ